MPNLVEKLQQLCRGRIPSFLQALELRSQLIYRLEAIRIYDIRNFPSSLVLPLYELRPYSCRESPILTTPDSRLPLMFEGKPERRFQDPEPIGV